MGDSNKDPEAASLILQTPLLVSSTATAHRGSRLVWGALPGWHVYAVDPFKGFQKCCSLAYASDVESCVTEIRLWSVGRC